MSKNLEIWCTYLVALASFFWGYTLVEYAPDPLYYTNKVRWKTNKNGIIKILTISVDLFIIVVKWGN